MRIGRRLLPLVGALLVLTPAAATAQTPHIIGGGTAPAGSFPYIAFVVYYDTAGNAQSACTGTVVSPNMVLTAAHCVVDETSGQLLNAAQFQVYTGTQTIDDAAAATDRSGVTRVILRDPSFSLSTYDEDAALLQLSAGTTAPAVSLPTAADSGLFATGTSAQVAGFGVTSAGGQFSPQLKVAPMTVQDQTICGKDATAASTAWDPNSEICAGDPAGTSGTCQGDSGGPLVTADGAGTPVEIGLVSRGEEGCPPGDPTLYTRTDALASWVSGEVAAYAPPKATTGAPTALTPTGATLNGTAVAGGGTTTYAFQWGLTTSYGSTTAGTPLSGTAAAAAALTGLQPDTTYNYRLVVTSSNGLTALGSDQTFTTPDTPKPPVGTYTGKTSQRLPDRLVVSAPYNLVTALRFRVRLRCTRGPKSQTVTVGVPRTRLEESFHHSFTSGGVHVTAGGKVVLAGTASGTLSASRRTRRTGLCRSGTVHWHASH